MKAVQVVDECLSRVIPEALSNDFTVLVTSDHGNAEKMVDDDGGPHTAHTTNLVPFIIIANRFRPTLRNEGKLADIAPTILQLMGLPVPPEMDGTSLLVG